MSSISLGLAVLIIFGYILHSTTHPEDVITGSQSEHFAPSLWFYFVPAQAAHFPYNIFSPVFSAFFESSIVIAISSAAVVMLFGSQVERNLSSSSSSSTSSSSSSSILSNSAFIFFSKIFLMSQGTFLASSFLVATMSTALVRSTHPHPEKEKHEQEETMKIGYAYFGPLAFATGVSVAAWCKTAINNNPFEEDDGGFLTSSSSKNLFTKFFPARFIPFYLVTLAFLRDLFFSDHPPTHSEFMLGIATRGPLFVGVLCAMWVTWFYFRHIEARTEFDSSSSSSSAPPTLVTNYGNASGRFAFHRCCPIPAVSEKFLLPVGNFVYSKILRTVTSYGGSQIDNKWTEFVAASVAAASSENSSSSSLSSKKFGGVSSSSSSSTSGAIPPSGTTVVNIIPQQQPQFAPLPGSSSDDAQRRRELAMAALQQRLSGGGGGGTSSSSTALAQSNTSTQPPVTVVVVDDEGSNNSGKDSEEK